MCVHSVTHILTWWYNYCCMCSSGSDTPTTTTPSYLGTYRVLLSNCFQLCFHLPNFFSIQLLLHLSSTLALWCFLVTVDVTTWDWCSRWLLSATTSQEPHTEDWGKKGQIQENTENFKLKKLSLMRICIRLNFKKNLKDEFWYRENVSWEIKQSIKVTKLPQTSMHTHTHTLFVPFQTNSADAWHICISEMQPFFLRKPLIIFTDRKKCSLSFSYSRYPGSPKDWTGNPLVISLLLFTPFHCINMM